jgi:hypothetical protein
VILVAYGCLVVALAALLIRGRTFRLPRRHDVLARLVGMVGATTTAAIALLVISTNHPTTLGRVDVLILLVGSVLYLVGLALWHERTGFILRFIGWMLAVGALAIPSTLTLLLPLVALLVLPLRPAVPDQTLAARPAHQ